MTPDSLDVLVLPHTHWDREWYLPVGRFRQRLVALVDELLDEGGDAPFLLDGQAIAVADYLAVRPERRDALAARLRAGTLEAGPWFVLADELIPSGEALVRNLLAGRRTLARLGASPPPVLYCPDSFGHPAALPTLAAGFGARLLVAWRGYGGRRWPDGDAVVWRGADGSRVLLFHLPPGGYEFGSNLPAGEEEAAARWAAMRDVLAPRARLGIALVQNGADHHARQRRFDEAVAALARAAAPSRTRLTTLTDFARLALERASAATLPEVAGELRDSYGYTWTLQGTFATRAMQKRRNAAVERLLVRDAEPWAALATARAAPPVRHLVHAAWESMLACHPHDTLCGCSTDDVARAMEARLDDATAQGRGIREDALHALAGHDPVEARERRDDWRPVALVRNPTARPRGGVAEVALLTFLRDVPVGPGSGGTKKRTRWRGAPVALDGGRVALQVLDRDVRHDRTESPRHYPDADLVEVAHAVAWLDPVPGYGVVALAQETRDASADLPAGVAPVHTSDRRVENDRVALEISTEGRVALTMPALGVAIDDLLAFEDVGDAGDLYTHSPIGRVLHAAWFRGARVLHRGPLRGTLEAVWTLRVPAARRAPDEDDPRDVRPARAGRHVEVDVTVRLSLDAGSDVLRIDVTGENRARDHRLRVVLRTGVAGDAHWADAAFGPVRRAPLDVPPEDRAHEAPPPTAPLHRWVARDGAAHTVAVVSDGLAEYEATADGGVAVTLVRAVGELSRDDLPERPGHAGWPTPTPDAQSLHRFAARLALVALPPWSRATLDALERAADDVLLPLRGATLRSALRQPAPSAGVELEGEGLVFGALKDADDGDGFVLRCVNAWDAAVDGAWRVAVPCTRARLARLDETPESELAMTREADASVIRFTAGPRAVVTIRIA